MSASEEWRASLVPHYEVSNTGRVRRSTGGQRTTAGRVLRPALNRRTGYLAVAPVVNGANKTLHIHDLVAAAFLGERPAGAQVNHRSGVKTDNSVSNLEYLPRSGNMQHASCTGLMMHGEEHYAAKLTDEAVRQLRRDRATGMSYSKLAAVYGVSIATAYAAATGKAWRHVK